MSIISTNHQLLSVNVGSGVEYSAGANINITNNVISGKDWSSEISTKQDILPTTGTAVSSYNININGDATYASKIGTTDNPYNVGSTYQPVYVYNGRITQCGDRIGSNIQPVWFNFGKISACTADVGESNQPIYKARDGFSACDGKTFRFSGFGQTQYNFPFTTADLAVGSARFSMDFNLPYNSHGIDLYQIKGSITNLENDFKGSIRPFMMYGSDNRRLYFDGGKGYVLPKNYPDFSEYFHDSNIMRYNCTAFGLDVFFDTSSFNWDERREVDQPRIAGYITITEIY